MTKILCAIDLSSGAAPILETAATLAKAMHATVEIIHVIEPPSAIAGETLVALVAATREAAESQLAGHVRDLGRFEIPVLGWVEVGRVDEIILAAATSIKPSLLVLGTHGRNPLIRTLVGSVAERCLRKAPCPILVVPPAAGKALSGWTPGVRPLKLTVGVDLSAAGETLLEWVRSLCRQVPCDVNAVHLYWPPQESRRLGLPVQGAAEEARGEIAQVLERELRARVGAIPGGGALQVRIRPRWGDDNDPLAGEAQRDGADVLVLGTSSGGGATTAIGVLRQGKVPVLCVPLLAHAADARPSHVAAAPAIRSVAVFTDLSQPSEGALSEALWLLGGSGRLTVCHVAPPPADAGERAGLRGRLQALTDQLPRSPGVQVETMIHENPSTAEGIVQAIQRIGPDLVVMCSGKGADAPGRLLDSTTTLVARLSPRPVVVVPPRSSTTAVPVDSREVRQDGTR